MEETAAALPDDLVLEVLARVADVAALFRCAMACKRWKGLIGDRSFLRRRWPEITRHPSFLVGFFTQRLWRPGSEQSGHVPDWYNDPIAQDAPPVFIPAPCSSLSHGLRAVSASADLLHGAMPLVARRGLLLMRLAPVDSCGGPLRLAVCNLLAGTCDVLPPLECNYESTSYCILTGRDCPSQTRRLPAPVYSTFFKVLAIDVVRHHLYRNDMEYNLHTFSSAEPGWAAPAKLAARASWPSMQREAAVCRRGMPHWLCGDWWLGFPSNIVTTDTSPEDGRDSLVELPLPAIQPTPESCHMAILDGSLSLFCMYTEEDEDLRLETWTWIEGTHWYRSRVVELEQPENKHMDVPCHMWSGEKSGTLLLKDLRLCSSWHIAYLETGEVEDISSQFSGMVENVVPIEIDWPDLFMSRLVGGLY